MSTVYVPISTYVAELLKDKHLRASQLAKELGVSHATVGRWLKGEDIPSPQSCHKLSRFTNTRIEDILRLAGYLPR